MLQSAASPSAWARIRNALGPLAGTIILDTVDFATFGKIGLLFGGLVGAVTTWFMCRAEGTSLLTRLTFCSLAALYCALPFTELIPMATIVAAIIRFIRKPRAIPKECQSHNGSALRQLQNAEESSVR